MEILHAQFVKLVRDESGAEVIEYAVIAGLICMGVIAAAAVFGKKVAAEWKTISKAKI